MGKFKYPFGGRMPGVPDSLLTALGANFRQAVTKEEMAAAVSAGVGGVPSAHAATHGFAGTDAITIGQSQVIDLATDLAARSLTTHSHAFSAITGALAISQISATGTPDATKFLRGDGSWQVVSTSGGTASGTTFTPVGNIAAANVQSAIQELDSEKVAFTNKIHELALPTAATPMGGQILTGLGAGTAAGHSLRYEQLFGTGTLALAAAVTTPGLTVISSGGEVAVKRATDTAMRFAASEAGIKLGSGSTAMDWRLYWTGANEATLAAGDVLKVDTRPVGTNDATVATTEFVQTATGSASSNRPAVRVYNSAVQSIPDITVTPLAMNSERYDTEGMHDTATNNTRLTCVTPGTYDIFASIGFATNATGERAAFLRLNGSTIIAAHRVNANSTANPTELSVSTQYQLVAGDYVEICAYHNVGAALNTQVVANRICEFGMAWVGGTGAAWGNAGASAWRLAAGSPATSSWAPVGLDVDANDTGAVHDAAGSSSRMVVPVAGRYQVNAGAAFTPNATGYRILAVCKNAGGVYDAAKRIGIDLRPAHSLDANILRAGFEVDLLADDYLELFVWQNSGAALALQVGKPEYVFLDVSRVGYQTNPAKLNTEVPNGFMKRTTSFTYAGGDVSVLSGITITGDGATPIKIQAHFGYLDVAAGTNVHFYLRRSAGSTQIDLGGAQPGGWTHLDMEVVIPPFTGTETFYVNVATTTGGGLTVNASAQQPNWIRATWAAGMTPTV